MIVASVGIGFGLDRANNSTAKGTFKEPALAKARAGSTELEGNAPLAPQPAPLAYDITYRLEDTTTGAEITTSIVHVRRPFDSHVVTYSGETASGKPTSERTSRLGQLGLFSDKERRVLGVPPALATGDIRPTIALPDALDLGLVERREQRQVLGTRCQVWRLGSSIAAGALVGINTRAGEYADACIDARGLLMEEIWILDGRRVRRRIVTKVDLAPVFSDREFEVADAKPLPPEEGGGSLRPVDPAAASDKDLWVLDTPPEGFGHVGRFALLHPKLDILSDPLGSNDAPRSVAVVDVWVRGADFLVVEQGTGNPFGEEQQAIDADLGPVVGKGVALLDLRSNEVRAANEAGYLRVFGTLTRTQLIDITATLRMGT